MEGLSELDNPAMAYSILILLGINLNSKTTTNEK